MMDLNTWGATSTEVCESEQSVLHLPREVRGSRISKAFYNDYTTVVRTIADVLGKPGLAGVPSAANVEGELCGQARRFFGKGGKVEHAMDYVLHSAKEQSPLGDGTWDEMQTEAAAENELSAVAYAALPTCNNDLAFADVAERLGLSNADGFGASAQLSRDFSDFVDPDDDVMEGIEDEDDDAVALEDRRIVDYIVQAFREARRGRV